MSIIKAVLLQFFPCSQFSAYIGSPQAISNIPSESWHFALSSHMHELPWNEPTFSCTECANLSAHTESRNAAARIITTLTPNNRKKSERKPLIFYCFLLKVLHTFKLLRSSDAASFTTLAAVLLPD